MQNQIAQGEEEGAYARAKAYLENHKQSCTDAHSLPVRHSSQEFRCQISTWDWVRLQAELEIYEYQCESQQGGPFPYDRHFRFSYLSSTSTLVIRRRPNFIQASTIDFLSTSFIRDTEDLGRWDVSVKRRRYDWFRHAQDAMLHKEVDVAVCEEAEGDERLRLILQIGYLESYDELLENVQSWLIGRQDEIKYAILIKFNEDPIDDCLQLDMSDDELKARGLKSTKTVSAQDFIMEGMYGPVSYQGKRWVGEIREVFWESWRLNPITRHPEPVGQRETIIPKTNSSPSSPRVQLQEFLSNVPADAQITPDWDLFRADLEKSIRMMALRRYQAWEVMHKGKWGQWKDRGRDLARRLGWDR